VPIYEYRCLDCHAAFEQLLGTGSVVTCPSCGSSSLDKLFSVPFISSGKTARQAGRTCCGQQERCDSPPCSEGSGCRRG
jgi:putative FmdB family regulatory protein